MDNTIELRACKNCGGTFSITPIDREFYAQIGVPSPTWCPDCRTLRRMAHCNEWVFYSDSCSGCKKRVVSQYALNHPWPVYCIDCWWSDKWRGQEYGREVDFSRSFLEQFRDLEFSIPHACVSTDLSNHNSEYTHHAGQEKNCYFIFHATFCEDCYYGYGVKKATSCVDVHNCFESELCYECVDIDKCYNLRWSQDCINCSESSFLRDCIGCSRCLLCTGLRNKQYCILNKQLTRAEYQAKLGAINFGSYSAVEKLKTQLQQLEHQHTWRNLRTTMIENSFGNYLINAKDSNYCFDCRDLEHCSYCQQLQLGSRYCYDIYQFGNEMELCYEGAMVGTNAYNVHFGSLCIWQVSDLTYCIDCYTSSNLLLCFGIRQGNYCILNKEYRKDEYQQLRQRIIEKMTRDGEYGEFFPVAFSQFGYNETTASRWYPMQRDEVLARGWKWRDDLPGTRGKETITVLPDAIQDTDDNIIDQVLACAVCARNYKVIAPELAFYKKTTLPLPRDCFDCRRVRRMKLREPRQFFTRNCGKCNAPIKSTFANSRPEVVFCEECYLKTVV